MDIKKFIIFKKMMKSDVDPSALSMGEQVQRGVGMYVVEGAANRLRQSEREQFLQVEWPEIRARMDRRLGVSARELLADA